MNALKSVARTQRVNNNISARANQLLGFVKRNVKTRSRDIKTKVYKALDGCETTWGGGGGGGGGWASMVQNVLEPEG